MVAVTGERRLTRNLHWTFNCADAPSRDSKGISVPRSARTHRPPEEEEERIATPVAADPAPLDWLTGASPQLQQSALQRADPGVAGDMLLRLQRGHGNQYASRLVSRASVARDRKRPTAGESVGAERGEATFMPGAPGEESATLGVGDKGFTLQMLKELPKAAGKTFGYYKDAHLTTVSLDFKGLDKQSDHCATKVREEQDELDSFFGLPPTAKRIRTENRDYWQQKENQLTHDRGKELDLVQNFNAGVPRANQTFVSLAKLEAMEQMLGVTSPTAMADALVKSLGEAQKLGERVQVKKGVGAVKPPEAAAQVTVAAQELTQAQKEMQNAWGAVLKKMMMDHAAELKKKGEDDEKRLGEITEMISSVKKIGQTIDVSMAVMSGGSTMIEGGGGGAPKPSEMMDLLAEESPNVMDKSGIAGAKKAGGAIASAMGIDIPTSVGGVLETAAKIYYMGELEEIRKRLAELNIQIAAYQKEAEAIGLKKDIDAFARAVDKFQLKSEVLQKAMHDRTLAYLMLGEQLDAEARKDPKAKAGAPGEGEERFATVMTTTAAVREVLAMAEGAKAGFAIDAASLKQELFEILGNRAGLGGLPEGEDKPLGKMLSQQKSFEANTEALKKDLAPIEEQAAKVMTALGAGRPEAAAY